MSCFSGVMRIPTSSSAVRALVSRCLKICCLSCAYIDYLPAHLPAHRPVHLPHHPPTFLPTYLPTLLPTYLCRILKRWRARLLVGLLLHVFQHLFFSGATKKTSAETTRCLKNLSANNCWTPETDYGPVHRHVRRLMPQQNIRGFLHGHPISSGSTKMKNT